jgi:hypothetical protein
VDQAYGLADKVGWTYKRLVKDAIWYVVLQQWELSRCMDQAYGLASFDITVVPDFSCLGRPSVVIESLVEMCRAWSYGSVVTIHIACRMSDIHYMACLPVVQCVGVAAAPKLPRFTFQAQFEPFSNGTFTSHFVRYSTSKSPCTATR